MQGLFFTFEGIDGCGKSTQIGRAHSYLLQKGLNCILTREPGGTSIGEKIRELLLSCEYGEMSNGAELLLYLAARAQHINEKILPALEKGQIVLCDRFQEATFAYQGFGRGYDLEMLECINGFATSQLNPTHTFVFDISVESAFKRMKKMKKPADRLEQSSRDFYEKIRQGYTVLAKKHAERISFINGEQSIDEIAAAVRKQIDAYFKGAA